MSHSVGAAPAAGVQRPWRQRNAVSWMRMGRPGRRDGACGRWPVSTRDLGPIAIAAIVAAWAALWLIARPARMPVGTFVGQLLGAESVLLMSVALVLIGALSHVESFFDAIDRAAIWHRRAAIVGLLLLVPHIMLSRNARPAGVGGQLGALGMIGLVVLAAWAVLPRWRAFVPAALHAAVAALRHAPPVKLLVRVLGGYERWRALHRTTGVFVAFGFVHGLLNGTPFPAAPVLRAAYLAMGDRAGVLHPS